MDQERLAEAKALARPEAEEFEVVCSNCSFPTVDDRDETGKIIGFHIEPCVNTIEEALAEGWLDHGLGLVCPKCSLSYLEELDRDRRDGAVTSVGGDGNEVIDFTVMRALAPDISDDTINIYVKLFRTERLNRLRVLAGVPPLPYREEPPRDEAQALEILKLRDALRDAALKEEKTDESVPSPSRSDQ